MTDTKAWIEALPERIRGLADIALNLAWSWSREARALFRTIDEPLWILTGHNPIILLQRLRPDQLRSLSTDPDFLARFDAVRAELDQQRTTPDTWYTKAHPDAPGGTIAYFCAEFGLHNSVPIYSGGLGILAGDHLKAASDLGVPIVGVGLLYTKGYFDQRIRLDGWQEADGESFEIGSTPLEPVVGPDGQRHVTTLRACGRSLHIAAYRLLVGRVPVYLLDTDLDENDEQDRQLSHRLYAPGQDIRLRQEWILGVCGVRLLRALGIAPTVWHANEGHAGFMMIERLRELIAQGTPLEEAVRRVRATSVFTTHTPVPAGHDVFPHALLEKCIGPLSEEIGVEREQLFALGRHPAVSNGQFHMTTMAIRLAGRVNGVSKVHGAVTRSMWQGLWPDRRPDDVPISHVTNGVHLSTWMVYPFRELLEAHLGPDWEARLEDDPGVWELVHALESSTIWEIHNHQKRRLFGFIRNEARRHWRDEWKEAAHVVGAGTLLDPEVLTIGFARRFATYKRADLIFRDVERLRRLLTNPWRPVQLLFAGKAHPADDLGKQTLQRVYGFTRDASFEGRVAFLEDHDMHVAHRLVEGVDLWLNVPRLPLEACGTSGMKAALNAVPQLGTLDGWWAEGYNGQNGWAIPQAPADTDVDGWDLMWLYRILEEDVVPLYYARDPRGIPQAWVERMRHALYVAGRHFTSRRMVQQYTDEYYLPAMQGGFRDDAPPTE